MATQTPEQIKMAQNAARKFGVTLPDKITSTELTGASTVPNITETKTGTSVAGVLGAVESSQDQFTKQLEQQRKDAEAKKKEAQSAYTARLFEEPTPTELKADQYQEQGVDIVQKELDDINSQLLVEQRALENEKRRIQDNAVGASMGQVQNMVNEVESKSLRKQADLAVIQMGLQGKYNTAKAIADRAVDAAMEKEKNILEALKINYEDNKEMFTKSEQREFDLLLSDRNNKYQEELANKKAISDYSIEAMQMGADGATTTAIRNAKTPEEAQAIASDFIAPIITQQRNLDIQAKQSSIRASDALAAQRYGDGEGNGGIYANDMDALTGNVLAMIPTKFGQEQFQQQMARARSDADRLNLLAGQALKSQPAEIRRDFANQSVGLSELDKAIALIDQGVQTGALQAGTQYVYNIVGKDFDPKLAEINQHLIAALQPYRNSVTGAAWGTQEDNEYQSLFGATKYDPMSLKQRLEVMKEVLKTKSATTLNAYANPMGYGDNPFASGAYDTQNDVNAGVEPQTLDTFDSIMGTSGTTAESVDDGGYLSNLWGAIWGK